MTKNEAERVAQRAELERVIKDEGLAGDFAREAIEQLPDGMALKYLPALAKIVADMCGDVVAAEVDNARTIMQTIDYPSGSVCLDGSGDLVRVEFRAPATPEFFEQ